jgi:hypothetical protein
MTVKPIEPTVVDDIKIWKQIIREATTTPSKKALDRLEKGMQNLQKMQNRK